MSFKVHQIVNIYKKCKVKLEKPQMAMVQFSTLTIHIKLKSDENSRWETKMKLTHYNTNTCLFKDVLYIRLFVRSLRRFSAMLCTVL